MSFYRLVLLLTLTTGYFMSPMACATTIKNLVQIDGDRDNQLVGYGIVIGLDGKGDSSTDASTARQSVYNMLSNFGIKHKKGEIKSKNVAAVMVTADVKSFAKNGSRMDVIVSSIGDAKSLQGGVLLQTPLQGADGKVYAVAQGPIVLGGFMASSGGTGANVQGNASVQQNHTTVGRVIDGAIIEHEIPVQLVRNNAINLNLLNPDFVTAVRIADAINNNFSGVAQALSPSTVNVRIPEIYQGQLMNFIAQVGMYEVVPDAKAKIIINERTGTIVATEQVRISTVAVSHGNLTITVSEEASVSQPNTLVEKNSITAGNVPGDNQTTSQNGATTKTVSNATVQVKDSSKSFMMLNEYPTVQELTAVLNQIGASTRDMITILQTIKAAGALQAELVTL